MKTVTLLGSVALSVSTCAICWWLGENRALPALVTLAVPIGLVVGSIPVLAMKLRDRVRIPTNPDVQAGEHVGSLRPDHTDPKHRPSAHPARVHERAFSWSVVSVALLLATALWSAWPTWVFGLGVLLAMLLNYWAAKLSTHNEPAAFSPQHA